MSGNIRLPNITGKTVEEQALQMKSYLTQLAGELNWALDHVAGAGGSLSYAQSSTSHTGMAGNDVQKKAEELLQNFNDLKGLIIKSSDIVNAYYEEINTRLEGLYVAQSDYGEFVEKTEAITTQNSTNISTNYSNIQLVTTRVEDAEDNIEEVEKNLQDKIDDLTYILVEVQAYIKSGLLDYDENGIPIYGVEVGQTNAVDGTEVFNKYARFTSDKLSFFDRNGIEVAYISDRKLFISNVEITVSFKIGGFMDTVMANKSVVTKWVGGG